MLCESLPCALSGSSLSSDIATQVTRIVFEQCPSKFPSFGCCHLFPPFPTHSLSLVSLPFYSTQVCQRTSVPGRVSLKFSQVWFFEFESLSYTSSTTRLFHNVTTCQSQAHSLEARLWGRVSPQIPHFQKRKECACLQGFTVHGQLHTSYMAASVGPKAQ